MDSPFGHNGVIDGQTAAGAEADRPVCRKCRHLDTVKLQIKGAGYCRVRRHLRSLERRADTCKNYTPHGSTPARKEDVHGA